jgi:hypothetical protein
MSTVMGSFVSWHVRSDRFGPHVLTAEILAIMTSYVPVFILVLGFPKGR